jgi:DNA-binding NtrC family response regulator
MVGRSPMSRRLFAQIKATAPHATIASFEGEAGTGKLLAARTFHELSPASHASFVPCLAEKFFESPMQSLLDESDCGTLLLTRVDELSVEHQVRLHQLLEWLGHQQVRECVRAPRQLLVSSHRNLRRLASENLFRADLCHRLTAVRFVLPPLREHREDISLLAQFFAYEFSAHHDKTVRGLAPGTLSRLFSHPWPGNIRELESVIHAAALEVEGQWIRPIDVHLVAPISAFTALTSTSRENVLEDNPNLDHVIMLHIRRVLKRTGGNKLRAAQLLGISRSTLYRMLDSPAASN